MIYSPEEYSAYIRGIFETLNFSHYRCYISPYIFRWNHPDELKSPDYDGSLLILARMVKTVDPERVSNYDHLGASKVIRTTLELHDVMPMINNFVFVLKGSSHYQLLVSGLVTELCTKNPYMKISFDKRFLGERQEAVKILRVASKLDELQEEYAFESFKGQTTVSLKLRELYLVRKLYTLSRLVSDLDKRELTEQIRPVLDGLVFRVSQLYSSRLYKFYRIPYPYSRLLTYRYTRDLTDYIHRRTRSESHILTC